MSKNSSLQGGTLNPLVARCLATGLCSLYPNAASLPAVRRAHHERDHDRDRFDVLQDLIEFAWNSVGPEGLLAAGTGVTDANHPLILMLLNSGAVDDIIQKEARHWHLFSTTGSTVRILEQRPRDITMQFRTPMDDGDGKAAIAMCGLQIELLKRAGARGLKLSFPRISGHGRWIYADDAYRPLRDPRRSDVWRISWSSFVLQPIPELDELLLACASDGMKASARARGSTGPVVSGRLRRVVLQMPDHEWTLKRAASHFGVSCRTLQRMLANDGTTFRAALRRYRLELASELIQNTDRSLTDIAHSCGFASAQHFSRSFRAAFGEAPSALRLHG